MYYLKRLSMGSLNYGEELLGEVPRINEQVTRTKKEHRR